MLDRDQAGLGRRVAAEGAGRGRPDARLQGRERGRRARPAAPASGPDYQSCDQDTGGAAIAACDRAIYSGKFSGKDLAYLYNDRGYLYMIDGDLDRGRADLDRAIQIDPEIYHPYWNRAEILRRKGDSEGARADYHKALSLNPKTEDRQKIEASLGALAAKSDSGDPAVITSPIWGNDGERAASVPAYPAGEAMPAYPASPPLAVSPTPMPAAPQPFPGR